MKVMGNYGLKIFLVLLLAMALVVSLYMCDKDKGPEITEGISQYDEMVFVADEVDSAILDYISYYRSGVPDSLKDLHLSDSLKKTLRVDDIELTYRQLSPTEQELTISGLEDMSIVYDRISIYEYKLIANGLGEEPIIFSGGNADEAEKVRNRR